MLDAQTDPNPPRARSRTRLPSAQSGASMTASRTAGQAGSRPDTRQAMPTFPPRRSLSNRPAPPHRPTSADPPTTLVGYAIQRNHLDVPSGPRRGDPSVGTSRMRRSGESSAGCGRARSAWRRRRRASRQRQIRQPRPSVGVPPPGTACKDIQPTALSDAPDGPPGDPAGGERGRGDASSAETVILARGVWSPHTRTPAAKS